MLFFCVYGNIHFVRTSNCFWEKLREAVGSLTCRRVGMADEADSKSVVGNHVRVQVPLPAGIKIAEMLDFTSVSVFFFTQLL